MGGADEFKFGRELPSFGRRRGRRLSSRKAHYLDRLETAPDLNLDRPAPQRLTDLFGQPVDEVWLEIGFGGGEHLLWQARQHPNIGIIGCEPFIDGVAKVVSAIAEERLRTIVVYPNDVRPVLRWLPDQAINRTFLLFPDPWPKRRHHKRRLVNPSTLKALARVMAPGSELRIATDVGDYARAIMIATHHDPNFMWLARQAEDWRYRTGDWPRTRYESKAVKKNRRCYYFRFRRE